MNEIITLLSQKISKEYSISKKIIQTFQARPISLLQHTTTQKIFSISAPIIL